MAQRPEPEFVDRDPQVILREWIARYEQLAGRPLEPAQVERLLIDDGAYRETLCRIAIQEAAKQNLWRYARYPMIDLLAELLGPQAARLAARPARAPIAFTLDAVSGAEVLVPARTRVRTTDDKVTFATDADATIPAGQLTVTVGGTATVPGPLGNGYVTGQVTKLVDPLAAPATATNAATTADGVAEENTDRMRARLPDALALQATAGPEDAYRAHALAAHPSVIDAVAMSPEPMVARVAILSIDGDPSPELLADVEAALSDEKVVPMNDLVEVIAAGSVEYEIEAELMLYVGNDEGHEARVLAAATAAADAYALERRSALGRAPVASQVNARLRVPGVYKVSVLEPSDPAVASDEWAKCTGIALSVVGYTTEKEPA